MPGADRHQKTEKPTAKRRREARSRGQVPHSPDLGAFVGLFASSMLLPTLLSSAKTHVLSVFSDALQVEQHPSAQGALAVLDAGLVATVEVVLPIAAGLMAIGIATNLGQSGLVLSSKALKPTFSRINPKTGIKRLFSPQGAVTLLKQTLKLALLGGVGYASLHSLVAAVPVTTPVALVSTVGIGASRLLTFVRTVALLGIVIGFGDYLFQRKRLNDQLKMTKQEVKDEAREREGDPMMKGQLRRRSYQIARSRVLQAVRTADVVVANPTHFSVALRYDRLRSPAPVVVAKGSDELARRIREVAEQCEIPLVEDPPLARYLYATTEAGHQVPVEIYFAVARLLAFIFSLPPTFRKGAIHSYPHSVVPEAVLEDETALVQGATW